MSIRCPTLPITAAATGLAPAIALAIGATASARGRRGLCLQSLRDRRAESKERKERIEIDGGSDADRNGRNDTPAQATSEHGRMVVEARARSQESRRNWPRSEPVANGLAESRNPKMRSLRFFLEILLIDRETAKARLLHLPARLGPRPQTAGPMAIVQFWSPPVRNALPSSQRFGSGTSSTLLSAGCGPASPVGLVAAGFVAASPLSPPLPACAPTLLDSPSGP